MEIYAIKTNEILEFVSFNILGHVDDVRRYIKECNESIKANVKNVNSGIRDVILMTKSLKEDVKDIKVGIHESVKEGVEDMKKDIKAYVKEGVKKALNEMQNTEQAEMEDDYVIISMENIETDDFPNPRLSALGELDLGGFIFALNMKFSP